MKVDYGVHLQIALILLRNFLLMKNKKMTDEQAFAVQNVQASEQNGGSLDARLKKIVIAILAGMTVFVAVGYAAMQLIDFDSLGAVSSTEKHPNTIIFFTPNYDEDIYEDAVYLGLDRNIYIYDASVGLKESLEPEDYEVYGESVQLMADFVNSIIAGDVERYNSFFADDEYYKESFTKQKLYNIVITTYGSEEITDGDETWTQYEFALEYMIRQNNGTLRLDLESDACRAQYITVSDRSGELLITSIRFAVEK